MTSPHRTILHLGIHEGSHKSAANALGFDVTSLTIASRIDDGFFWTEGQIVWRGDRATPMQQAIVGLAGPFGEVRAAGSQFDLSDPRWADRGRWSGDRRLISDALGLSAAQQSWTTDPRFKRAFLSTVEIVGDSWRSILDGADSLLAGYEAGRTVTVTF